MYISRVRSSIRGKKVSPVFCIDSHICVHTPRGIVFIAVSKFHLGLRNVGMRSFHTSKASYLDSKARTERM